jgi:DNA-binding Lrp family transcriptional regulator
VLGGVFSAHSTSIDLIAAATKLQTHVVRYHLKELLDLGLLRPSIVFNPAALGYQIQNLLLALTERKRAETLEFLKCHPAVTWLAQNGGEFGYEITVLTKHPNEVLAILEELGDRFGETFEQKQWASEVDFTFFGYKFLMLPGSKPRNIRVSQSCDTVTTDPLDIRIVYALRTFGDSTQREVAQILGIPVSTLSHRAQQLRTKNVIIADQIYLSTTALKIHEAQLILYVRRYTKRAHEQLTAYCSAHPNVVSMIRCLGTWDYKLIVQSSIPDDIESVRDQILGNFSAFISRCQIVPRRKLFKMGIVPQLLVTGTTKFSNRRENAAFERAVIV